MILSVINKKLESSEMSDLSEKNTEKHVRSDFFLFFIYPKLTIFPARKKTQAALPPSLWSTGQPAERLRSHSSACRTAQIPDPTTTSESHMV